MRQYKVEVPANKMIFSAMLLDAALEMIRNLAPNHDEVILVAVTEKA